MGSLYTLEAHAEQGFSHSSLSVYKNSWMGHVTSAQCHTRSHRRMKCRSQSTLEEYAKDNFHVMV